MREILFRGKHVDNGEWVYGFYIKATHHWHDHGIHEDWMATDTIQNGGWCNVRGKYAVIHDTVGQYTGLTDKNGTKIFEGDIIKQTFRLKQTNGSLEREIISVVEYGISYAYSDVCGVCQRFSDGSGIAMLSVMDTRGIVDCEVIGNIHDNPELMKGERYGTIL